MQPTVDRLRQMLTYDATTGALTWIGKPSPFSRSVGKRAGKVHTDRFGRSYRRIRIGKGEYSEHRVIMALVLGEWPRNGIDHVNGDGTDNRLSNLREATHAQNMWNTKLRADSLTGFKGVSRMRNKYRAYIKENDKQRHLGVFVTPEQAHAAYVAAANALFGEFARAA